MSSSSSNEMEELEERLDEVYEDICEDTINNIIEVQTKKQKKRAYIERNREAGHIRLWNDYFSENPTYEEHIFRRRFRMNKELFMSIVYALSQNVPFFQHRPDATGRLGLSPLQKCTAAIRMLSYGSAADAVDEYLRLGESTALSCLHHFTYGIVQLFGEQYLRRPTPEDLQRLLDIGEKRGFPGGALTVCIGSGKIAQRLGKDSTLNDINVLDRSPVFDDIIEGRAPRLEYVVNGHKYKLAYYLTDGIYPKWSTFIQSILRPQGPKARLFVEKQEAARKDVERAFGVLQARFAIVKNPALTWDKKKIGKIMRACIIIHNIIVENERNGYTRIDISEFEEGNVTRSSHVETQTEMPTNLNNIFVNQNERELRDIRIHEPLKKI
ncbi:uncharacterized protein LOC130507549 [Raphanus sativus]|uniref:Uncharacterized protein LOC130507549 n=1 Tax=Raphanus sativus TaxID=3726 RepID=A0A9W3D342_RAPSA|nr:uncharacterized protein LOC130507549 [Raphanus sativus]